MRGAVTRGAGWQLSCRLNGTSGLPLPRNELGHWAESACLEVPAVGLAQSGGLCFSRAAGHRRVLWPETRSRSGTPPGLILWFAAFLVVPVGLDTCFSKSIPAVTKERSVKRCCLVFILRLTQSHSMIRETVPKLSDGSSMSAGFVTQDYLE